MKINLKAFFAVIVIMLFTVSLTAYAHGSHDESVESGLDGHTYDHSQKLSSISLKTYSSAGEYLEAYIAIAAVYFDEEEGNGYCDSCWHNGQGQEGCKLECYYPSSHAHSHFNCCNGQSCRCISGGLGCIDLMLPD